MVAAADGAVVVAHGAVATDDTAADRPVRRVLLIAVALAAATAALLLVDRAPLGATPATWFTVIGVALAFAVAERFVFHIEYQRQGISFSVSEIPAALALVFLSPLVAIAVRLVASLLVIGIVWRPPAYKVVFNTALFAFEMSLAYSITRLLVDPDGMRTATGMLAIAAALFTSTFVGSLVVSATIACFEHDLAERLRGELRTSIVICPIVTMVATITAVAAMTRPEMAVFAFVPISAGWLLVRQHGRLLQQHRDLESLHGFAGLVGRSLHVDDVAQTAVAEAMRLLRAERGALQVYGPGGEVMAAADSESPVTGLPSGRDDVRWQAVFDVDGATACRSAPGGHVSIDGFERWTTIAVTVRDSDGDLGLLVLSGRTGVVDTFEPDDLSRVGMLSAQLAASLRKALLHADLERAALHDGLTGRLNRLALERRIEDARPMACSAGCDAVLLLGLDHFKAVNDTLGRSAGDRVLREFADRVAGLLDAGDVLARLGGDEFAVLARRIELADVVDLAERIVAASFAPISVDDLDVVVPTSIGVSVLDLEDPSATEVLQRADSAMYAAKREHTGVVVHHDGIDHRTPDWLSLLGGLREALDDDGLEVHYQPKVDLVTATVVGAEALVRWHHPRRGWVNPADFVRIAEESGLIKQLTDHVLVRSIRAARSWADAGYELGVAVNLSTHDLLDDGLPTRIAALLDDNAVAPRRLTLEITETALLADTPRTTGTINRLAALGVRLSLDDFGTGYSSLGYLRRLPVNELKVDRSFVKNLLLDEQDEVIVRSTIDLGHNLGLQVVAEGLENEPMMHRLKMLGCDIGQGYGISRPLPPDHFMTWLRTTGYAVRGQTPNVFA